MVKREVIAGLTTFFTMSYILVVNPAILSACGMPKDGVLFATAVSSAIATFLMGVYAELPFALAPGMGLNAYFSYTVCLQKGISWHTALTAVFIEGVIFLIMALFGLRKAILESIPKNMAYGISAGIGLFIALIGLKNAKLVESSKETLLKVGDLKSPEALITLLTLIFIAFLVKKNVKGSLLLGILFSAAVGALFGKVHFPTSFIGLPKPTCALQLNFSSIIDLTILPVVLTFLAVDIFDTVGTLSALCTRLGIPLNDKRVGRALTCDAVGTTVGGLLGTSTVTTYVESATGVAAGGRSGITAITVSLLFLLSLFFYPLIAVIPTFATSPVLIYVGFFMAQSLRKIEWENFREAFPAFMTFIGIPFTFSISEGIGLGFLFFFSLKLLEKLYRKF